MSAKEKLNLKIIEESNNKIIFEMNSNYGFAQLLIDTLWNLGATATWHRLHPQMETFRFMVEAKEPKKIIKKAIENIKKQNAEFLNEIKKLNLDQKE